MIVTITMNPALDKTTSVDALIPEKKLRCEAAQVEAGGGGINVSKAIRKLGGSSLAIFPSGGLNGQLLEKFLNDAGINYKSIPIEGNTRESFTVDESRTHAQYRFVLPGPELKPEQVDSVFQILNTMTPAPSYIIASGSLPPGVPENFFQQLAACAKKLGARCIIDSSGKPLELAVHEGVYLLKPNLSELCALAGKSSLELNQVDDAALEIINKGECEVMVVSLGPSGALLVTRDGYEHIPAPTVKKTTTVGAGDSMVAGMVYKLERGAPIKEVVQFGVACGTAATMNRGTELFKMEDVDRLFDWMVHHSESHKISFENR